ncbi:hypothetical protein GCM10022290_14260 [Sagittula marina]
MVDDGIYTHLSSIAVAFKCEPIDQADGVIVQRGEFQLLLDLRAALLGCEPSQKPSRRFSFKARRTCLAVSLDWSSSNGAMICRVLTCMGSSPITCVMEKRRIPFFASVLTENFSSE